MKKYMIILLVSLLLSSCAQPQGELSMPAKEDSTLQDSAGDVLRERFLMGSFDHDNMIC